MISTAGDATLSVADPSRPTTGHLINGTFSLPQPLQAVPQRRQHGTSRRRRLLGLAAEPADRTPVRSNDTVTVGFSQLINSTDALRTGSY